MFHVGNRNLTGYNDIGAIVATLNRIMSNQISVSHVGGIHFIEPLVHTDKPYNVALDANTS